MYKNSQTMTLQDGIVLLIESTVGLMVTKFGLLTSRVGLVPTFRSYTKISVNVH
jgi:hypothetical protein